MNRFGYLPETNNPQHTFNENMYANQFGSGYNHFGYGTDDTDSDTDSDASSFGDLDFGNAFGRLSLYNRFGGGDETSSDEEEPSDEEHGFGYASDSSDSSVGSEFGSTDFGKKLRKVHSDAKKAMRMAHREGISLKEAWRRVKGGRRTSSRKTTKRRKKTAKRRKKTAKRTKKTSKRSSRSEAKRAMKLKHSRGISLKAAWKIVKKERR